MRCTKQNVKYIRQWLLIKINWHKDIDTRIKFNDKKILMWESIASKYFEVNVFLLLPWYLRRIESKAWNKGLTHRGLNYTRRLMTCVTINQAKTVNCHVPIYTSSGWETIDPEQCLMSRVVQPTKLDHLIGLCVSVESK